MDPCENDIKRWKKYYDMIYFMADSDEGIPLNCPCGGKIVVVDTAETETDTGNKYFICDQFKDDELHRKKNWFVGVQEEIARTKREVDSQDSKIRILEFQVGQLLTEIKAIKEKFETVKLCNASV